jgi:hypothetical protein
MSYNSHGDLLNGKPAMTKEYRSKAKTLVPDLVIEYSKHHRRDFVICSSLCLSRCVDATFIWPLPPRGFLHATLTVSTGASCSLVVSSHCIDGFLLLSLGGLT